MTEANTPAVVLLSGGVDSTVLLHHVIRNLGRSPVHAISYNYGQRHSKELACARWQARAAGTSPSSSPLPGASPREPAAKGLAPGRGALRSAWGELLGTVSHHIIDISFLGELLKAGSTLIAGGDAVPDLKDLDEEQLVQPPTYVPNRNMMLLSMAVAYAEANDIYEVFYGAQAQDEYGYWDCTSVFVERLNHVLELNRERSVKIVAPFVTLRKAETVKLGVQLGVDFAHTWSCYRGNEKPCGTCPTCVERLNAFAEAGVIDPLLT